ncbi:twin-arginine translocation signal domain-containing protein [Streptomyces prasinus]|uniref:twin-arginine translocation signal domain-containing protein n=1 Tax=Streptomyces prasinus TaxID=67345 RepID=UPI0036824F5A
MPDRRQFLTATATALAATAVTGPVGGTPRQTWRLAVPAGAAVADRSLVAAASGTWAGRALRLDAEHRFPAGG